MFGAVVAVAVIVLFLLHCAPLYYSPEVLFYIFPFLRRCLIMDLYFHNGEGESGEEERALPYLPAALWAWLAP